jgi:hypothetical protein
MATVYKVEIVSDWINYTEEELKIMIEKAFEKEKGNEIKVTEIERKW